MIYIRKRNQTCEIRCIDRFPHGRPTNQRPNDLLAQPKGLERYFITSLKLDLLAIFVYFRVVINIAILSRKKAISFYQRFEIVLLLRTYRKSSMNNPDIKNWINYIKTFK